MKKLSIATIIVGLTFGLSSLAGGLLLGFGVVVGAAIKVFVPVFAVFECFLLTTFLFLCVIIHNIKKENEKTELQLAIEKDRQLQLLSLYKRFGITPQRNAKGDLMNFYELLGIEPEYDEFGERVPTVYEILQILPKFDEFGNEVPNVIFIKNKAANICVKVPETLKNLKFVGKENANADQKAVEAANKPPIIQAKEKAAAKSSTKKSGGGSSKKGQDGFDAMKTPTSKSKADKSSDKFDLLNEMFSGDGKKVPKPTFNIPTAGESTKKVDEKSEQPKQEQNPPEVVEEKESTETEEEGPDVFDSLDFFTEMALLNETNSVEDEKTDVTAEATTPERESGRF